MIKIFTLNKNKKIELTESELKELLDEAYWEGYRANSGYSWTYTTPNYSPYITWCTTASNTASNTTNDTITFTSNNVKSNIN